MLEMPEMFERYMSIGKQEYEKGAYEVAMDHFEKAYELKDDLLANVFLTRSLMALEDYDKAFQRMSEYKGAYLLNRDYQDTYFELLIKKQFFLEIEKFFLLPSIEVKDIWLKKYEVAKNYQLVINETAFEEMKEQFNQLPNIPFWEQKKTLGLMKYFPKEVFVTLAKPLLVSEELSVLFRNDLVNQLVQLKITTPLSVLTWEKQIKTFIPSDYLSLQQSCQESVVLQKVSHFYTENNPSLKKEMMQLIKLHIGYLYPFNNEVMTPTEDWVKSYMQPYARIDAIEEGSKTLEDIYVYQKRLEKEVANLGIFQ
ncbi:hypothetical protein [Vagococcus sp.]|uniref:hypothetical protein n=1 Tax=Vagococcus sp. TaxID=1933889 RepID=UPI002FC7542D